MNVNLISLGLTLLKLGPGGKGRRGRLDADQNAPRRISPSTIQVGPGRAARRSLVSVVAPPPESVVIPRGRCWRHLRHDSTERARSNSLARCAVSQRIPRSVYLGCFLGALFLIPLNLVAQVPTPIPKVPCSECFLRIDTVATIDRDGPVPLSDQVRIVATSTGELVLRDPVRDPHELLRFDMDGRHLGSIRVDAIQNPGFFIPDPAGWLILSDFRTGQLYRISRDGEVGEPIDGVDGLATWTFLSDGRLIINAHSRTPARFRYALHMLRPGGAEVQSFDRHEGRVLTTAQSIAMRRALATDPRGRVWSFHVTQHQVDLWDVDNLTVRRYVRNAPWFQASSGVPGPARLSPPPGAIVGAESSPDDGHLWLLARVAASDWTGYELPPNDGMGRGPDGRYVGMNRHLHNDVYDTVIEVVDPDLPAVILTYRLPVELSGFIGEGYVVEYRGTTNDIGAYQILRLSLGGA